LWPGDLVEVALELFREADAVVAPARAVVQGREGSYVYVVDARGVATIRDVRVGRTAGDLAVIQEGLSGGETVVTEGQLRLSSGARVEIQRAPALSGGKAS